MPPGWCGWIMVPGGPGLVPYCDAPRLDSDGEADANWPGAGLGGCSVPAGRGDADIAGCALGIWLIDVGSPSKSA
ncbi:MAG: hypothetical protein E6J90_35700 [Deltaproteobacteria bacterium]|nr:MAG: hypothetical protein E6J90_35700 [Deltaproteobacteria bacterium]